MRGDGETARRQEILDAAWAAFSTYGFRKTSMDDIARGAGISRPTLYLHFRNKDDIFRSLVGLYYDGKIEGVAEALARDVPPRQALADAFAVQAGKITAAMLSSPHGKELWDAGSATSSDLVEAGEARLQAVYRQWLERGAAAGRIGLPMPAGEVAAAITSAVKGIKMTIQDAEAFERRLAALAALLGAGLEASAGENR